MNTNADSELDTFLSLQTSIQVVHGMEDTQACAHCSLGVIFMCLGIPKVHQEPIAQKLSDVPFIALDNLCTRRLIGTDDVPVLFGVELGGEAGGIDQVAEHHRELS